jgi:DNA-binding MarR family transcriptional regulator
MRTLYVSRAELRENLLMLLAERPRWTISELREQLRVDSAVLGGVIQRAIRAGEIARVAYGCVRLVYRRDNKRAVA